MWGDTAPSRRARWTRRHRAFAALVTVFTVSGCAIDESGSIAVQRPVDAPAGLDILFADCGPEVDTRIGGDRVTDISVRVEPSVGPEESVDTTTTSEIDISADDPELPRFGQSEFDRIIWSVHSDEARHVDTVRVGSEVDGFTTVTPLTEPLPQRLLIVVRSDGEASDFAVADLSVVLGAVPADGTFVFDENGTTTFEDFQAGVRADECGLGSTDGGRSTLGASVTSLLLRLLLLTGGLLALITAVLRWRRRVHGGSPP